MIRAGSRVVAGAAALAIALAVVGAAAQTNSPAKPKPKAGSASTIPVTVTNKRKANVVELDVALAGSPAFKPVLRNLAPGKQTIITLTRDEDCRFDFYIKYDDGVTNTVPGLNVCDDGKLNLVE
jgi:hypothetical protein